MWERRDGKYLRTDAYLRSGGLRGAVDRLGESVVRRMTTDQQEAARQILLRLSVDERGAVARRRMALADLQLDRRPDIAQAGATLIAGRLLTVGDGEIEIAHEALQREWRRLADWLQEDAQGARTLAHLSRAATGWEAAGRDAAELYRGARLDAALEWTARNPDAVNDRERAFVEEGRALAERDERRRRRTTRRLRALLAGTAGLLIVAAVAWLVALDQRSTARDEARSAVAQRLGAQALVQSDLDLGLLLAREGLALEPSTETESYLLAALLRAPALTGVVHGWGPRLIGLGPHPDDGRLVASGSDGSMRLLDLARRSFAGREIRGVTLPVFRPDGGQAAITDRGGVILLDAGSFAEDARLTGGPAGPQLETGLTYSRDGRRVTASWVRQGDVYGPTVAVTWDVATGRRLGRTTLSRGDATAVAYTPDGSLVTASQADREVTFRDADGTVTRRIDGVDGFRAALAPDGQTLVAGGRDGTVQFVDLRTGAVRLGATRHSGFVQTIVFSPDGRTAVTAADDRAIIVWDTVATAPRETFEGHSSRITSAVVDSTGSTLYTSGLDGFVMAWDLRGDRRLARPFQGGRGSFERDTFAVSGDGRTLAIPEAGGVVNLVDAPTLRRRRALQDAPRGEAVTLAFADGGRLLAVRPTPSTSGCGTPRAGARMRRFAVTAARSSRWRCRATRV